MVLKKLGKMEFFKKENYHLLAGNISDIIFKQDLNFNITYVSPSVKSLFGYKVGEAKKLKIQDLLTPESYKNALTKFKTQLGLALKNKDLDIPLMEYEYIRKNRSTFWGELKVKFLRDKKGTIIGSLGVLRDITERKKIEEELKSSQEKYKKAYERAEFYKDLFTHDMGNILQSIISSIDLAELSLNEGNNAEVIKFIRNIQSQVHNGGNLIANVNILYLLEQKEKYTDKVNVIEFLDKCIDSIKVIFPNVIIKTNYEIENNDNLVLANNLLINVFENLLLNSIKHNSQEIKEISIRVQNLCDKNKKICRIETIDNGKGIPDKIKSQIFKGKNKEERLEKGFGIGLMLCNKIINTYNGKIWVEDRVLGDYSKGSKFILVLNK
ncbi:MAG: PAS domain S-box protein [Candidatus Lokiarchaeota archaeon]|nr:PAS domain S-box protein [Candidatus Lokiarchaeota archaeon]MBD3201745.1 PAS domain S-box protein [Candidatus Lokiarchaeota archaeon]